MRLATFFPPGGTTPRAGEVRDGRAVAFADETTTVRSVLASGGAAPADGESFALGQVKLLAPIPEPRAIFAIGLNYDDHIAEAAGAVGQERKRPESPIVFLKLPSSAAPPHDPVHCPAVVKRLDYE